jgi:hypothetical protein
MPDTAGCVDVPGLPPRFEEACDLVRGGVVRAAQAGIPEGTICSVLLSDALWRLVQAHGPKSAARMLRDLADSIGSGTAPGCKQQ